MSTSRTTTSGVTLHAVSTAWAPSVATPTTSKSSDSIAETVSSTWQWSSTRRTLGFGPALAGALRADWLTGIASHRTRANTAELHLRRLGNRRTTAVRTRCCALALKSPPVAAILSAVPIMASVAIRPARTSDAAEIAELTTQLGYDLTK